ncbi:hypothetical protein E2542_SST21316 [Spatholobus suberectus]|nr:hypothetical protein E2542_SST21316 [Spatholobus suberectus]
MSAGDAYAGRSSKTMPDGGGGKGPRRRRIGGAAARPRADHLTARRLRPALPPVLRPARRMRTRPNLRALHAPPIQGPRALPGRVPRPRPVDLRRRRRRPAGVELPHGRHQALASRAAPPPGEPPPPAALPVFRQGGPAAPDPVHRGRPRRESRPRRSGLSELRNQARGPPSPHAPTASPSPSPELPLPVLRRGGRRPPEDRGGDEPEQGQESPASRRSARDALRSFAEAVERGNGAVLPRELCGLRVACVGREVLEFVSGGCGEEGVGLWFEEIGEMVERRVGCGVVVDFGDLEVLVNEENGWGESEGVRFVVGGLGKLLEVSYGRLWLMGAAASYESYIKFLETFPSVDKDWDLQLLPIVSVCASFTADCIRVRVAGTVNSPIHHILCLVLCMKAWLFVLPFGTLNLF